MTVLVTPNGRRTVTDGLKGYPFAGLDRGGRQLHQRLSIELIGRSEFASYATLYRTQPWVAVCVNKLARAIGRLPLKTYERGADDSRQRVTDHPLAQVLRRPFPRGSAFRLKEAVIGSTCVYGNALVWKFRERPGMPPAELWPIPWRHITPVSGANEPISYFEYRGPAGKRRFLPEEVIHFAFWAPDGELGVSPLEQLSVTLALEEAGRRYAKASFSNGARPSAAVQTDKELDKTQRDDLSSEIRSAYEGPDNAFRLALLTHGLKWQPMAHTSQEAQTIEHRKLNREEAAALFDIPPPVIHILDRATFSNIDEQHQMLYMDTLGPWNTWFEETLEAQLIADEPAYGDVFVEFDLSEVMKGNVEVRSQAYLRFLACGYTINEIRKLENLARIDHPLADVAFFPANMIPIGEDLPDSVGKNAGVAQALALLLASQNGHTADPVV